MGGNESGESGSTGDNNTTSTDFSDTGVFSWIANGFKNVIEAITSILNYLNPLSEKFILKDIISGLGNVLKYINPFSDDFILKGVLSFLSNILSYLNPFSDNFFGHKIVTLFSDLLKSLFIPSEENLNNLTGTVKDKFEFVETIKIAINSIQNSINNVEGAPSYYIDVGATKFTNATKLKIIDFSFYAPYKNYSDTVITGFIYAFYIWRLFIKLPNIISGAGGAVETVSRVESRGGKK